MSASSMAPDSESTAEEAKNLVIGMSGLAVVFVILVWIFKDDARQQSPL